MKIYSTDITTTIESVIAVITSGSSKKKNHKSTNFNLHCADNLSIIFTIKFVTWDVTRVSQHISVTIVVTNVNTVVTPSPTIMIRKYFRFRTKTFETVSAGGVFRGVDEERLTQW